MHNLLSIGITVLLIAMSADTSAQDRVVAESAARDRFVGAWRLASLEEPDGNGKTQKVDCTGLLVYSSDGHMSVQVMYRNPQPEEKSAPVHYAQGGYEASYGTYHIDDAHSFTFHVEGALVRSLIGKDLKRVYEWSGNQLIVRSPDPNEHWRVAWERY